MYEYKRVRGTFQRLVVIEEEGGRRKEKSVGEEGRKRIQKRKK